MPEVQIGVGAEEMHVVLVVLRFAEVVDHNVIDAIAASPVPFWYWG